MKIEFGDGTSSVIAQARSQTTSDLLRRTAARHSNKIAVVDRDRRLTFAELDRAVNRAANALRRQGLAAGERLALLSHNCLEFAVLTFATARVGVVLVPINFMLGADEAAYILAHCEARAVVAEDALTGVADKALAINGTDDVLRGWIGFGDGPPEPGWLDMAQWWSAGDDTAPDVPVDDDEPIRLMYTSGTESRPKGVMLSSRSLISQYVTCIVDGGMSEDDVEIHAMPLYHCAQLDCFLSVDIYLGATSIVLANPEAGRLLETIEAESATKLFCPPTVWISLLRHPDFDSRDLSSLRKGYYGASAMPVEVLRELQRRLPHVEWWNFYGQTELAPVATILKPTDQGTRPGSAGRAALNVETMVVDDTDRPVAPGTVGEIVHRSPQVTLGYYRNEESTAAAFANGWFHSGDLGFMTVDGYLSVVDRKKDMIKTGGENVASREVEEALYELDGVAEVAVFGVAHPHWIEAVTAVVVPKPGATLTVEDVHMHARAVLASYKRPKFVELADALPKNPSGKILKRVLREQHGHLAAGGSDEPIHGSTSN